ncbi:MAG: succinate dehydrogenase iron-sulfur subunit, partial [Umezawaea sp.]
MTATTTGSTAAGTTGQASPKAGAVPSFTVTLKIARFNPETDTEAHWETYEVTSHATDRVLDA